MVRVAPLRVAHHQGLHGLDPTSHENPKSIVGTTSLPKIDDRCDRVHTISTDWGVGGHRGGKPDPT